MRPRFRPTLRPWLVFALSACLWIGLRSAAARACAPAPPEGFDVTIRGEQAVIVWDAEAGREHFIRRADIETEAEGLGFIVPTPTPPELAEVENRVFDELAYRCRPDVRRQYETEGVELGLLFWMSTRDAAPTSGAGEVEVLRYQSVGGYDAVVLAAGDPDALVAWLGEHGYAHDDDLAQWAAPYVEKGWTFTAFKLAKAEGQAGLGTTAVRMSFSTAQPFYPYREPQGQREGPLPPDRTLRVFFVSDRRYQGALEDGTAWPAQTTYAKALPEGSLSDHLPGVAPTAAYLTVFVDRSNPRPGTADLLFSPSDEGDVIPEPIVQVVKTPLLIPLELIVLLLVMLVGIWFGLRRRKQR